MRSLHGSKSKKVGILIESDFYEKEIFYYEHRFAEEGFEVHWLTRLWGQPALTFYGHEYKVPFELHESFEGMTRRGTTQLRRHHRAVGLRVRSPALYGGHEQAATGYRVSSTARSRRQDILKGIICHGMWLICQLRNWSAAGRSSAT